MVHARPSCSRVAVDPYQIWLQAQEPRSPTGARRRVPRLFGDGPYQDIAGAFTQAPLEELRRGWMAILTEALKQEDRPAAQIIQAMLVVQRRLFGLQDQMSIGPGGR